MLLSGEQRPDGRSERRNHHLKHYLAGLVLLTAVSPAWSEPGVALLLDSRQPGQSQLSAAAKKCLSLLIRQNDLVPAQFSLVTVDAADPAAWAEWKQKYALKGSDLPALAFIERSGNRVTALHNLVRSYGSPLQAAEEAMRCAGVQNPDLLKVLRLRTAVHLDSDPPGAAISDGTNSLGLTPCDVELKPGHYRLTMSHPDCLPATRRVDLQLGQRSVLNVTLEAAPSRLVFDSTGVPLNITVDGRDYGPTPVSVDLPAGPHKLQASAPGFTTLTSTARAEPQKIVRVRLTPTPERVRVSWAGTDAQGFVTTSQMAPLINQGLSMAISRVGGFGLPWIPYSNPTQNVDIDKQAVRDLAQRTLTAQPRISVIDKDADCMVKLQVQADPNRAVAVAQVLDPKGAELRSFTAQRDMPSFTMDAAGSASVRVGEAAEEATRAAADWIAQNVHPAATAAPPEALQTMVEGPLTP